MLNKYHKCNSQGSTVTTSGKGTGSIGSLRGSLGTGSGSGDGFTECRSTGSAKGGTDSATGLSFGTVEKSQLKLETWRSKKITKDMKVRMMVWA